MMSFELNNKTKIIEYNAMIDGIPIDNILMIIKYYNLKIYVNGKRCRKKIIMNENSLKFTRPLQLSKNDSLTYKWSVKNEE
ncbi:MAG TPA: hypothetical protein VMZ91_03975 [Candidatus Paceibacterota bacterium]|nr:hypothetical protein [Candidatus Paceibacterota bacterium]